MTPSSRFDLLRALARPMAGWIALLVFALPFTSVLAAKDTPFGAELIAANFPTSTTEDAIQALTLTAEVGGHSSFVWHWSDRVAFPAIPSIVSGMRAFGLKSLIQVGAIFLNAPGPPDGLERSFGNPATRAQFLSDVTAIAKTKPDYLVLATEINILRRFNAPEFEHYRTLYSEAYSIVKLYSPGTHVGVSFLYSLWFYDYYFGKVDVPALLAPMDFIAFTTYPEWLIREGHYPAIADIAPEFHGASRAVYPSARIIFSEVGWASKVRGNPEEQAEFVRNMPRIFSIARPELVTWAVLHDMEFFTRALLSPESEQFLVSLGVDIDALFGHFNAMGLIDGFGNKKPGWHDAMKLNFTPP